MPTTPAEPTLATARQRARAEIRDAIVATAGSHVAEHGAAALSMRAVARDLGMVSSALYRYFPGRDDLLTALIVEAYDSLGAHTEAAVHASRTLAPARRWIEAAMAIRDWSTTTPHSYSLLYGTPVPGYAAPDETVAPGTRVSRALAQIVRDAVVDGRLHPPLVASVSDSTAESFIRLRAELDLEIADETLLAMLVAWTQLFGLLTFELFGQTRNFVEDDGLLFRDAAAAMAATIGLEP